jgi:hypothetical protein
MRNKRGLFILILMVTCFILFVEAGEKTVDVKIIPNQKNMVPGELFLMDGFQEGAPCPGQSKGSRQMANKLPEPYFLS